MGGPWARCLPREGLPNGNVWVCVGQLYDRVSEGSRDAENVFLKSEFNLILHTRIHLSAYPKIIRFKYNAFVL